MKEYCKTIGSLILYHLRIAVPSGFLGGALAGLIEALYRSVLFDYTGISLVTAGLIYYAIMGAVLSSFIALITAIMTGLFIKKRKIRHIDLLFFSSSFTYMLIHLMAEILSRQYIDFTILTLLSFFVITLSILVLFGIALVLSYGAKAFLSKAGIEWKKAAFIVYAPITIALAITVSTSPQVEIEGEPYIDDNIHRVRNRPNIIFIVVDALRYDWLSCYGYDIDTPNTRKLADDGIKFTNAFVQCSWTKPSIASMMTSLYPSQHKVETFYHLINPKSVSLANVMKGMGYYTIGFHNNPLLRSNSNFHKGFNHYRYLFPDKPPFLDPRAPELNLFHHVKRAAITWRKIFDKENLVSQFYRDAITTSNTAIEWISLNRDKRFFMFIHYMDVHDPYFKHPYSGVFYHPGRKKLTQENLVKCSEAYRDEIRYTDKALGTLFDYLDSTRIYDSTLIVFSSDHGEEFDDHGGAWHGLTLYNEMLRNPLIIKLPESEKCGTIDSSLVQSIDIAPTLVKFAGGEVPEVWEGKDIFSDERPGWNIAQLLRSGENPKSIQNLNEKLYLAYNNDGTIPPVGYYDLRNDPMEKNNLADDPGYQNRIKTLRDSLQVIEERLSTKAVEGMKVDLDQSTREQLKALGYIE